MNTRKSYFEKLLCNDEIDKYKGLIDYDTQWDKELKIDIEEVGKIITMLKKGKIIDHD